MNNGKDDGYFYAALQNVKNATAGTDQTLNVTYYDETTATQVINRPKVTNPGAGYYYYLKLGSGSGLINTDLKTTSSDPTWVCDYVPVYPFEGNNHPLLLKLDFTLTADDGSGDVIHVRGARAIVPAEYVKWKSNFAYTYIFKISDKSNGTTGDVDANDDPIDPTGLKPITFDGIVVDVTEELQETITSVSTKSITTYAEGAIANEYTTGKPVYVAISYNTSHSIITPTAIGEAAKNAQIYKLSRAASEAEVYALLNGSPIKDLTKTATTGGEVATIEATVPLTDGTTPAIANVKFTPSSAGTYAYVYTTTKYVAPSYLSQSDGTYDSSKTYYMKTDNDVYYAVAVTSAAAFAEHKAKLYIIDSANAGTPGDYDVKVIKVQ